MITYKCEEQCHLHRTTMTPAAGAVCSHWRTASHTVETVQIWLYVCGRLSYALAHLWCSAHFRLDILTMCLSSRHITSARSLLRMACPLTLFSPCTTPCFCLHFVALNTDCCSFSKTNCPTILVTPLSFLGPPNGMVFSICTLTLVLGNPTVTSDKRNSSRGAVTCFLLRSARSQLERHPQECKKNCTTESNHYIHTCYQCRSVPKPTIT